MAGQVAAGFFRDGITAAMDEDIQTVVEIAQKILDECNQVEARERARKNKPGESLQ